jgi:hypothetical protein
MGLINYPRKIKPLRILAIDIEQSNGASTTGSLYPTWGVAQTRGADNGGASSYFRKYVELVAARRGHITNMSYIAYGNCSIPYSFVGMCVNWVSGQVFAAGAYVLSNGRIWLQDNTLGTESVSTTAPSGTGNQTLNGISWVDKGVPTARDVHGQVYEYTDVGRWDPKGRMASSFTALSRKALNYDIAIALIGGTTQKDSNDTSVTQARYAQANINLTNALLAAGCDFVGIGLSFTTSNTLTNSNYTAKMIPAANQALAAFSGDSRVFKGAYLQTDLGIALSDTVAPPGMPYLIDGGVHATQPAFRYAGEAWYAKTPWRLIDGGT